VRLSDQPCPSCEQIVFRLIERFFTKFNNLRKDGAPGAIRTRDLSLRRRILYPAELRAHIEIVATSVSTR
jgi:hypothetical protein